MCKLIKPYYFGKLRLAHFEIIEKTTINSHFNTFPVLEESEARLTCLKVPTGHVGEAQWTPATIK